MDFVSGSGHTEPIELILAGPFVSKKNNYAPAKRKTKAGRPYIGFRIDSTVRRMIDSIAIQIPGAVRDLGLVHPDVDIWFTLVNGRIDRDGIVTTLLDVLVNMGVIRNDSVASFNGRLTIHPAVPGYSDAARLLLTPNDINGWGKVPHGTI